MKFLRNTIIITLLIFVTTGFSQNNIFNTPIDTIIQDEPASDSPYQITSLNLTGFIEVMVLVIGFPDRSHSWPQISNHPSYPNEEYPLLGAFPSGITLRDYIAQNGPINVEE